jgi:hypothetical protein
MGLSGISCLPALTFRFILIPEMDWSAFINGKRPKTPSDDAEAVALVVYHRYRDFERLASRVEGIEANGVGAMQFADLGHGRVGPRGNKRWVDQVDPGLWEEVERVGSEPGVLSTFLVARARQLGRI